MPKPGPNSKYWKDKADSVWSDVVRMVGKCQICEKPGDFRKDGLPVKGLHAHHMIGRGRLKYRYDPQNGICLCVSHHGSHPNFRNRKMAAHGSEDVHDEFIKALKVCCPDVWDYYEAHKDDKRELDPTYEECYNVLKQKLEELKGK